MRQKPERKVNEIKGNKTILRPKGSAALVLSNDWGAISIGLHPNQHWEVGNDSGDDYLLYYKNNVLCIKKDEADKFFIPLSWS